MYLDKRFLMTLAIAAVMGRGAEWFADSVNGASGNDGKAWGSAVATIAAAQTLASAGDRIFVSEVHAETIIAAGGIEITKAGLRIIGTGVGDRKPTITMGTATTATFKISADNVVLRNIRFVGNIDSLVKFIDVAAHHFTIEDCDFVTSSTKEALSFINLATTKDFLTVRRCRFFQPTDPAGTDGGADTGGIFFVDSENILIEDCTFYGNFETACIHNRTTAGKNVQVRGGYLANLLSGAEPFQLVDGCTGGAFGDGMCYTPAEAAATEATLFGTLGAAFFISPTFTAGNDGGAGGQGGIIAATAS